MSATHEARARRLFATQRTNSDRAWSQPIREAREAEIIYAADHPDHEDRMQALAEMGDCILTLRERAAYASDQRPFLDLIEHIEDGAFLMTKGAWRWDDERQDRAHGDRLDAQRAMRGA
jgi:hypothetical protein